MAVSRLEAAAVFSQPLLAGGEVGHGTREAAPEVLVVAGLAEVRELVGDLVIGMDGPGAALGRRAKHYWAAVAGVYGNWLALVTTL